MQNINNLMSFYKGKRVLITGHTGFKGSWLTKILLNAGAFVTGFALNPPTEKNLFSISGVGAYENFKSVVGDMRDLGFLKTIFQSTEPEIVFHLAAQPIVRDSYKNPIATYSINVMGTVNVLECVRLSVPGAELNKNGQWNGVKSFLNVTTDKVYKNNEWCWGYREDEPLDGFDPYSNSKSCSEMVTHSYKNSFFSTGNVCISTARAGNVIGGGDFANDRIIPDCIRALETTMINKQPNGVVTVRNPDSIRPYQHVLEPLFAYLLIAKSQYENGKYASYYNVGPDDSDCVSTGYLVSQLCSEWNKIVKGTHLPTLQWKTQSDLSAPHEASFLKLDCSKIKSELHWKPCWHIDECIEKTAVFYKIWLECKKDCRYERIQDEMDREIVDYFKILSKY